MNANELRIGNWVDVFFTEDEVGFGKDYSSRISAIQNNKVLVKDDHHWHPIDKIRPIPLTPEILEKAGFKKIGHRIDGIIYKKEWLVCNERVTIFDWRGGYISNAPKYLHQLQNLYFALTGEELEINL